MYLKMQTPDGNWDIREAKTIQYSDLPCILSQEDCDYMPGAYSPFIPKAIHKVLGKTGGWFPHNIEAIPFQDNLIYEVIDLPEQPNEPPRAAIKWRRFPEHHNGLIYVNMVFDCKDAERTKPDEWFGLPLYNYAILDNAKAIVFPTKAYVLNDDGKTIAKIG